MIRQNGAAYCRNPYFLHSVTSMKPADNQSMGTFPRTRATSKASHMYGDGVSMSQYGLGRTGSKRRSKASRMGSEGTFEGMPNAAPRLRRKARPFSAPRHQQGFRRGKMTHQLMNSQQP